MLSSQQAHFDGRFPYGTARRGDKVGRPEIVGKYASDGWGQYDMHGNVRERCADDYTESYDRRAADRRDDAGWLLGGRRQGLPLDLRKEGDPAVALVRTGFRVVCTVGRREE